MELNEGQKRAVDIVCKRYYNEEPYSLLVGPAGCGKTFTTSYIIKELGLNPAKDVAFLSPTGKACQVLKRNNDSPNIMTLHKFLYNAKQNKYGKWYFEPKEELDFYPSLIIADEASMIDPRIWNQLLTHHIPVIALGDEAQLSPVSPESNNHLLDQPHARLTEIMRQAEGNEIIDLATHIRTGHLLETYKCKNEQVQIISKRDLCSGHYLWADQIICAMNDTRTQGNKDKREMLGYDTNSPEIGDTVISLKNHWDFFSEDREPLINGSIGRILDYNVESIYLPKHVYKGKYKWMWADIETDYGDVYYNVPIDYNCLTTGKKTLTDQQEMQLRNCKWWKLGVPFELNYSYFATCWKMQGDQANNILLFEENFPYDWREHQKYLYTGITRAIEKCVIVKK